MNYRNYIEFDSNDIDDRYNYYHLKCTRSDPYEEELVKRNDRMLHRTLSKIFGDHNYLSRDQIKELTRAPKEPIHENLIFKLIMEWAPALSTLLLMRNRLSLLWIAVLSRYQDSAELLVRSGADVNELYGLDKIPGRQTILNDKSTLIHALLQMYPSAWNERFIDLIIAHGADFKAQDLRDSTALHFAVKNGRVRVVKMLIEKGADVNVADDYGITPVLEAARTFEVDELVPLLMKNGADITERDEFGRNILCHLASAFGEPVDLARVLIEKGVSPHETESDKNHLYQPIHIATINGKIELVKLFLDHGADVNARGYCGQFPLFIAARRCPNPAMIKTLLKRGANIDQKTIFGHTALYDITFMHQNPARVNKDAVAKVKMLLSVDADMFAEVHDDGSTHFDVICRTNIENLNIRLMLKRLALRKACLQQPSIESKDEMIVKKYPIAWNYYRDCIEEIDRIKATKFIKSGIFFELLTKCQCQIVALTRNPEFKDKFRCYDLSAFSTYAEDILEAFQRLEHYYSSVLDQENLINEAIYNILPYMIVRKVARYALNCEICEIKQIVQASRSKVK